MRQIPQPPKFWKNAPSDFAHFWGMGLLTTDFYSFDFESAFSDMEIPFLGKTRTLKNTLIFYCERKPTKPVK